MVDAARDYCRGVHAAETARPFRWLLPLVLVVALASALWDAVFGSVSSGVVSVIYLAALAVELSWWPRRQAQLLPQRRPSVPVEQGPALWIGSRF